MTTRTSIELHDDLCRVVEVDVLPSSDTDDPRSQVRVRSFVTDLPGSDDPLLLVQALRQFRKAHAPSRDAVVTVWGLGAFHRHLKLPDGEDSELEMRARSDVRVDLSLLEARDGKAVVAMWPARRVASASDRPVSLIAVPESALEVRLKPIRDAGFRIERAVTPALAMVSLAARNRDEQGLLSYIALEGYSISIAVVRDGSLLLAREMEWGYRQEPDVASLTNRLSSELRRTLLYVHQTFRARVTTVVVCGSMPSLRSLIGPLGQMLEVPVHTLDSLVSIDVEHIPEPADVFRSSVSALRLAIAVGAEPDPCASLIQPPAARSTRRAAALAALLVVVAALMYVAIRSRLPVSQSAPTTESESLPSPEPKTVEPTGSRSAGQPEPSTVTETATGDTGKEVSVTAIMYSSNRRVAIVDGHVVGVGDRVGANVVFDIRPRAVVLEAPDGRRWTVQMQTGN